MIKESIYCSKSKINDLLMRITKLAEHINICPPAQLEVLLKQLQTENNKYDPWLETHSNFLLHWSFFAEKMHEEDAKVLQIPTKQGQDDKDSEEYLRWNEYLKITLAYNHLLESHTEKNKGLISGSITKTNLPTSIETFQQIINEQYNLIFYQTLLNALAKNIQNSLDQFQKKGGIPSLHFSAKAILKEALSNFEAWMIKVVLYQYEMVCLVERAAMLEAKIVAGRSDYVTDHETITQETFPELLVVKKFLTSPFTGLKFKASEELCIYLSIPKPYETPSRINEIENNYSQSILRFLKEKNADDKSKTKADENIDPAFCIPDSHVKARTIATYFMPKRPKDTKISDFFSMKMERFKVYESLTIPNIHLAANEEKTTDERLLQLREVISAYQAVLVDIAHTEGCKYKYRSTDSINKRSAAVDALHNAVNTTTTLNRDTINTVKSYINKIKSCDPHWRELNLIQQILDIITFGYRALSRWRALHEKAEVKKLYTTVNDLSMIKTEDTIPQTLAEHSF